MPSQSEDIGPVVVGIDGSEASIRALRHAVKEAAWRGVQLHVLHALNITPAVLHLSGEQTITTRELAASDREEVWKLASPILEEGGVDWVRVDRNGPPGTELASHCDEVGASVVVVGPRGRGMMTELLLGSTAQQVVKNATCDVLVVKSGDRSASSG